MTGLRTFDEIRAQLHSLSAFETSALGVACAPIQSPTEQQPSRADESDIQSGARVPANIPATDPLSPAHDADIDFGDEQAMSEWINAKYPQTKAMLKKYAVEVSKHESMFPTYILFSPEERETIMERKLTLDIFLEMGERTKSPIEGRTHLDRPLQQEDLVRDDILMARLEGKIKQQRKTGPVKKLSRIERRFIGWI